MKKLIGSLLALVISGCQIDPYTHAPTLTSTDWYDVGMEDAISGVAIKDDDTFNDSPTDRVVYLKGYAEGQKKTCQPDFTYARGLSGKSFPASCDTVENASQLHEVWQKGADENASTIRLN
ncbi:putative lipoprotein [Escherichia marmotae]|uniref:Putative lipoprotein n=2 Tax=Enterobacteriaceae TaxID=543 RepID=A0A7Z8ZRH1_9ESCH|nr:lipoprotein [Escherichia sp. KTE159]VED80497.1 putative lipoprotein [Escherichia marmotae]